MTTLVILAAGMGSRYGGLKQIEPLGPHHETLLDYAIFDAVRAGFTRIVFVIRKEIESDFRQIIGNQYRENIPLTYVFQELRTQVTDMIQPGRRIKPWGTAQAVLACEPAVDEPFAVINADDFYGKTAYRLMFHFLNQKQTDSPIPRCALVGFSLRNTLSPYGPVSRGICRIDSNKHLLSVSEKTKILEKNHVIAYQDNKAVWHPLDGDDIVSMNFWGFTPHIFPCLKKGFNTFLSENKNEPDAEFLLPAFIDSMIKQGQVIVTVYQSNDQWVGITYPQDKSLVSDHLKGLKDTGEYPEKLW